MKKKLLLVSTLLIAGIGFVNAQTILYSESFNSLTLTTGTSVIPSNMIGINANNASANTAAGNAPFNVSPYLTTAWVAKSITIGTKVDTAAESTSWLSPAGAADKWLITPSITGITSGSILSWAGFASDASYNDGYEVYVSATAGANLNPVVTDFTAITSNKVFTIPAEDSAAFMPHSISLAPFAGQTVRVAFRNNSNDMFHLYIDDIKVLIPALNDIALQSITPIGLDCWGAVSSTKTIAGTIVNNGSAPITAFTASYTDGTANGSSNFTGLNVNYGQTYNFTIATPYSITAATQANLKVYVNLASDANHTNDTLKTQVAGYSFLPNHKVVYEEATGTWCGFCVRGLVFMDSLQVSQLTANTTVRIAVHNGDPMVSTAYDAAVSALVGGYPTILVDRAFSGDPSDAFTAYTDHINDFGLGDLTLTQSYNSTNRLITATVNANLASSFTNNNTTNDYRLAVVITEDMVHGTATGYDQHNYYTGNAYGPLSGAGHDFAAETDPVPAARMYYNFVARTILGGFSGQANSLPSTIVAGSTYSKSFTYTVPAAYDVTKMKINALLIDAKNNIIYNGNSASLVLGINSIDAKQQTINVYPNPVTNNAIVNFSLSEPNNVSITIVNALGQVVSNKNLGMMNAGIQNYSLDAASLSNGLYFLNIKIGNSNETKKIAINR